ncbi:repair of iron centres family protein [Kipferlia bialata]|uniref:Repair of iron centres family protein n=1 Tax=Kipferlia bialata TaxID=797122 RepID=A0A9K3GMX4_9EUKA|nr:repair of iron centres family protein [Kipferlia bialata]|eukprot:g10446.t1
MADTLVRGVALSDPRARAALEAMGIDTCCGGGRPLKDAAAEAGIPLETVVSAVAKAVSVPLETASETSTERETDWREAPIGDIVQHIQSTHHATTRLLLDRIHERMTKVVRAHGARHGAMLVPLQKEFETLRADLLPHLSKEEDILFPYMLQLSTALETGM